MDKMLQYFKNDRFAEHTGIELNEVSPGHARASMIIRDHHLNAFGSVHGGAIFTLADLVFAAACNSHGTLAVAINAGISFVKSVSEGTLRAEAKEVSVNKRISTYSIKVRDDEDEIVATFQGMAYRKQDSLF